MEPTAIGWFKWLNSIVVDHLKSASLRTSLLEALPKRKAPRKKAGFEVRDRWEKIIIIIIIIIIVNIRLFIRNLDGMTASSFTIRWVKVKIPRKNAGADWRGSLFHREEDQCIICDWLHELEEQLPVIDSTLPVSWRPLRNDAHCELRLKQSQNRNGWTEPSNKLSPASTSPKTFVSLNLQ